MSDQLEAPNAPVPEASTATTDTTAGKGFPWLKIYAVIGVIYFLYRVIDDTRHFSGKFAAANVFVNIGKALVWPLYMFPWLGQLVWGVILLAGLGWYLSNRSAD